MMTESTSLFKARRLVLPLVLLSIGFTIGYSFLNWLLVAKTGWLPIDDDLADYWLPCLLAWVLVLFFIQRRLRLLKLSDKLNNLSVLYHFAAVAVVIVPVVVAQGYVRTTTGDLTHVKDADQIATVARAKFYVADHVCMHLDKPARHGFSTVTGRSHETLVFDLYMLAPICSTTSAAAAGQPVWIGIKYHHTMSNSASEAEKKSVFDSFARESVWAFDAEDPRGYQFLETLGRSIDRSRFEKTLSLANANVTDPVILIPHLEPFSQRSGNRLQWTFGALAIGPLLWLAMVLLPPLNPLEVKRVSGQKKQAHAPELSFLAVFLIPRRSAYGLPILIDVNIAVFVVMAVCGLGVMSFDPDDLLTWGASYRPAIHGWGMLRLIASQFVHGGLVHLVNNLYGLLFAGLFLAPVATNWRLIGYYLLCGLGGSIGSVVAHPTTVSVGASGAIFGLYGTLMTLVLFGDTRFSDSRKFILLNAGIFVALNLVIGAASHGVDNAAHIGGLLTGTVIGTALWFFSRGQPTS